jgi:hypothetical protein
MLIFLFFIILISIIFILFSYKRKEHNWVNKLEKIHKTKNRSIKRQLPIDIDAYLPFRPQLKYMENIINGKSEFGQRRDNQTLPIIDEDFNFWQICDKHGENMLFYDSIKYKECPKCKEKQCIEFISESDMKL